MVLSWICPEDILGMIIAEFEKKSMGNGCDPDLWFLMVLKSWIRILKAVNILQLTQELVEKLFDVKFTGFRSDLMQSKMVDRIGLGPEERELKLGTSFTNSKECAFHTLRYDFKPASVDTNKMATVDVGTNSQITVTVPPNLIFKGNAKPYHRQCIAIVNPETGEVTLEKLTFNIQVKKIRSENQKMSAQKMSMIDQFIAGQKPKKPSSTKSNKSHTTNSSGNSNSSSTNSNKNSGLKPGKKSKAEFPQAKSNMNNLLPIHSTSARNSPNSQARFPSGLSPSNASPSKITVDDQSALDDWFNSVDSSRSNPVKQDVEKILAKEEVKSTVSGNYEIGELSDSSSSCSSSSSGDSSDSSSDSESQQKKKVRQNVHMNNASPDPEVLLKEDLQLSESGSDSD